MSITYIMSKSVSRVLRSALSWGKVGGHGVERATSSERNGGRESDVLLGVYYIFKGILTGIVLAAILIYSLELILQMFQ